MVTSAQGSVIFSGSDFTKYKPITSQKLTAPDPLQIYQFWTLKKVLQYWSLWTQTETVSCDKKCDSVDRPIDGLMWIIQSCYSTKRSMLLSFTDFQLDDEIL